MRIFKNTEPKYAHEYTNTHEHTHTHKHTHSHTHKHTQTHTQTHTHIHAHTHTCKHTEIEKVSVGNQSMDRPMDEHTLSYRGATTHLCQIRGH